MVSSGDLMKQEQVRETSAAEQIGGPPREGVDAIDDVLATANVAEVRVGHRRVCEGVQIAPLPQVRRIVFADDGHTSDQRLGPSQDVALVALHIDPDESGVLDA